MPDRQITPGTYSRNDLQTIIPLYDEAIRAKTKTALSSKVADQIKQKNVIEGSELTAGDLLLVIDAGAVRFRPMMLTKAAVIVGAGVILFDPIFQGLAIS